MEEFEASLRLLENTLRPIRHDFRAENITENVTPNRIASFEERIESAKREMGEGLFQKFKAANDLDIRLYNLASDIFRGRLSAAECLTRSNCG